MGNRAYKLIRANLYKILTITLLVFCYFSIKYVNIIEIDFFARDSLQYLNSKQNIDKRLVTVSLNIYSDGIQYPHNFNNIKKIVSKLNLLKPKAILIMMEPLDFNISLAEKKSMYDFLVNERNIYLNMSTARATNAQFAKDDVFLKFHGCISFLMV